MALKEYDFEKEPIVTIVKKILNDAIKMKASDIHFDPNQNQLSVKFRINGNLTEYTVTPNNVKLNLITRIKILANMNITDSMSPQTGIIHFESEGKKTNMSVSTLPVCDGEKIVIHISNYANKLKSISKIGISINNVDKIKKLLKEKQGIILITGHASSGKTTTMYAMLKELISKSTNIISIEEPVKYQIDGINQVEINPEKGLTYKKALKHTMLQDPNIVCIDNLIDDEITRDILRAASTGRLIVSSIYTQNAFTTLDTLLNMNIENYLLGANLNGIISQRLVKRLCPKCREKRPATQYEITTIKKLLNKEITELYEPKSCDECQNGYIEQMPVVEVIKITDEIKKAITSNNTKQLKEMLYSNNENIIIDAANNVVEGNTSFDEMIRIIDIENDFTEKDKDIKNFIIGNINKAENIETPVVTEIAPVVENKIEEKETKEIVEEIKTIEPTPLEVNEPNEEETNTPVEEKNISDTTPVKEEPTPIVAEIVEQKKDTPAEEKIIPEASSTKEPVTQLATLPPKVEEKTETATPKEELKPEIKSEPVVANEESIQTEEESNQIDDISFDDLSIDEMLAALTDPKAFAESKKDTPDNKEENQTEVIKQMDPVKEPEASKQPTEIPKEEKTNEVKEEKTVTEQSSTDKKDVEEPKEEQPTETKKVVVPPPITPTNVSNPNEEEEDDEDDFSYGEDYQNSF